jgi:hypothetical protein
MDDAKPMLQHQKIAKKIKKSLVTIVFTIRPTIFSFVM